MVSNKKLLYKKANGVYYTPSPLADFLVTPLIKRPNLSIFDPAYGKGSLLLAAERICKKKAKSHKEYPRIYGCDKSPSNGPLKHLEQSRLRKQDFFKYSPNKKFDLVFMNPPYVRHHRINKAKRKQYQKIISQLCKLRFSSDLWAYFLVKSVNHLKESGSIAAILPWSFLQAGYARDLRIWLAKRFSLIRILGIGSNYFDETEERILLVWLKNYGQEVRLIQLAFSEHIKEKSSYSKIERSLWESSNVAFSKASDIDTVLKKYIDNYGFVKFSEYANVRIGIVTGADKFFIMTQDEAKDHGFQKKDLIPIFTTAKEFSYLQLDGNKPIKQLLYIPKDSSDDYKNYILEGENYKYHLRAHSLLRNPWYSIQIGKCPEAFFPYRVSYTPYMVLNDTGMQCTNSIHRIYFKKLSECQKKWIQISLLSAPGQLSLEAFSKTYGSGILKIEPKALKNSLIHLGMGKLPNPVYNKIAKLISLNNKKAAMKSATEFINNALGISKDLSQKTKAALKELQCRRLGESNIKRLELG